MDLSDRLSSRTVPLQEVPKDRTIKFGSGGNDAFISNAIKTTKYTWKNFLPLNLWEQMHKFGNVYFLSISILMYLGEKTTLFIGTIKAFSTLATLMMMMAVTALMAALDDKRRNDSDVETNSQKARVAALDGKGGSKDKKWEDIIVSDFLIVSKDEEIPADFILFYSSGEGGNCYVSTANLDGETNLKLKSAPPTTQALLSKGSQSQDVLQGVAGLSGQVTAEAPRASIHDFNGRLKLQSATATEESLGAKNILLRGTILKNTAWVLGLVVYTGKETRMVMNAQPAPSKRANLEVITNTTMVFVLVFQCVLALISNVAFLLVRDRYHKYWYLYPPDLILPDWLAYWLTFVVLYSNMMPISLYPTMEACNAAQAYFIKNDIKMFYKDLLFPAGVKSSNLCQEIGQVSYIFSDKTGTLTQNVMELKCIYIPNHEVYGQLIKGLKGFSGTDQINRALKDADKKTAICDFLEILAVSHTVMVSVSTDGAGQSKLSYEAESPDEGALVESAAELGHRFMGRKGQELTLKVDGREEKYTVLITNEFNSTRKRMSVVVKKHSAPAGKDYLLLVKGADNEMLKKAISKPRDIEDQLLKFGMQGLRTLVLGRRECSEEQVKKWQQEYDAANKDMHNRDKRLDEVAEAIEKDFTVAGATAIEDKLQDDVEKTIEIIREAGIKLWVLTGDKLETAREIGFSSNVLSNQMTIHTLDIDRGAQKKPTDWFLTADVKSNAKELNKFLGKLQGELQRDSKAQSAMLVTGAALENIMHDDSLKDLLLEACGSQFKCSDGSTVPLMRVVIACRVSPLQKAEMVRLVRNGPSTTRTKSLVEEVTAMYNLDLPPVTLAIGDGANDVPMIQEAQVGVGIAGREGRQAVNNADFALGQFKYLQRLLFVHGRWNYRRQCKFTKFTFWRNAVQVFMTVYYNMISGFSGTSLFEDWIRLSFNFLCSLPIMATGMFDRDISASLALQNPCTYAVGKNSMDLSTRKMGDTLACAFTHSMVLFWLTYLAFPSMDIKGAGDYYTFGTAVYTCLILDMNYRVGFLNCTHNRWTSGAIVVSCVGYVVFLIMYPCNPLVTKLLAPNMYMVPWHMVSVASFWFCLIAVPACAMSFDIFISLIYYERDPVTMETGKLIRNANTNEATGAQSKGHYTAVGSDDGAATDIDSDTEELKKYVDVSKLAQQEEQQALVNWWPIMSKEPVKYVLYWNVPISLILLSLGCLALYKSAGAQQIRIHYEGRNFGADPWGTKPHEVFDRTQHCTMHEKGHRKCRIHLEVPSDMHSPILLYYAIGPFYQNYNDYLKSEVSKELLGQHVSPALRQSLCKQSETRINASGYHIFPCGMKATSCFNDTFRIKGHHISSKGIAWKKDLERYENPEDYPKDSSSKRRPDRKTSWLYERYPGVIPQEEGVDNEHFAVWMRPSATSRVWNPYGHIYEDLKAGEKLEIEIDNNFPMHKIEDGWKQLVITEVGPLGARHHGFSYIMLVCGSLAALTCLYAIFVHKDYA